MAFVQEDGAIVEKPPGLVAGSPGSVRNHRELGDLPKEGSSTLQDYSTSRPLAGETSCDYARTKKAFSTQVFQTQASPRMTYPIPSSSSNTSYASPRHREIPSNYRGEDPLSGISSAREQQSLTDPDGMQVDYLNDEDFSLWLARLRNHSTENLKTKPRPISQQKYEASQRYEQISPHSDLLDRYVYNSIILHPQNTVELEGGDFLKVREIAQNATEVSLRGWRFRRAKHMDHLLAKQMNEVCWILQVDNNDPRSTAIQGMETVAVSEVIKRRRIRLTNQPFPAMSFRDDLWDDEDIINKRVLVCRWKSIHYYPDFRARHNDQWCERTLSRLQSSECDNSAINDNQLREGWRGRTIHGGASLHWVPGEKEFRRQENISSRGIKSRHSLKGLENDFPIGDPMERGCVATFISDEDLTEVESSIINDLRTPRTSTRQNIRKPNADMRRVSITPNATPALEMDNCPEVIQIDAEFKQILPAGTFKSKYTGKVTSTFSPRKRTDKPYEKVKPSVKRSMLDDRIKRNFTLNESDSDSDSDRTLGHGPSPEPKMDPSRSPRWSNSRQNGKLKVIDFTNPNTRELYSSSRALPSFHSSNRRKLPWTKNAALQKFNQSTAHRIIDLTEPQPAAPSIIVNPNRMPISVCDDSPNATPATVTLATVTQPKSEPVPSLTASKQRYTFGDCFCGGGGMSRAAVIAGLRVEWGFDFDRAACESYSRNFFGTTIYNLPADEFIQLPDDHRVDILHMSPPCQFFSPAHTHIGKDDEMNTASLFALGDLIEKAKPRIATLEQTAGLSQRHGPYFSAVINMFTSRGYSVRWRLLNCIDYGLPQRRLRLVIIASCPGEPLPPFPSPTHSNDTSIGLKPLVTVNEAILSIPPNWADHDVEDTKPRSEPPYSGDTTINTICTNGRIGHPSGQRDVTLRELACLQGFPLEHKFGDSGVRKQIGNAVPPVVGAVLLKSILEWLKRVDGVA